MLVHNLAYTVIWKNFGVNFSDAYAHPKIVYSKNFIHIDFSIIYNTPNREYPKISLLENLIFQSNIIIFQSTVTLINRN